MRYPVGWPFWRTAARAGAELMVSVDVSYDAQTRRYIAIGRDLDGLVCEAGTWDELVPEVHDCIGMLLEAELQHSPKRPPYTALHPTPALA